ncbi:competence protein CoiA family protein [Promicromonospora sp. NPDC059942]|uniref:competence protein CoiA family protein n=1 Tax=Promicromonospora sp. NPDC059942 TaxID=3347009 RepID=UPI00365BD2FD
MDQGSEVVAAFLNRETRQVWARHRITGEPVFIAPGAAAEVRKTARAEWTCLVPGCEVAISTRGGSKRDHFFHVTAVEHPGGPESANHLASKAMLAQWATREANIGAVVVEEQTLKNVELEINRRPDVLVTWPEGQRLALEVEYKHFPTELWAAKQTDLDREEVTVTWLVGHTRVQQDPKFASAVRVPALGRTLAAADRHVLVINPATLQIGTLAGDSRFTTRLRTWESTAWLRIDDLDTCVLDPDHGLVTPTMRRIDAAMRGAARAAAEQAAAERAIEEALEEEEQRQRAAWHASQARRLVHRVGGNSPQLLRNPSDHDWAIEALPVHWHAVLYETLIYNKQGREFAFDDCWTALREASITWVHDGDHAFEALTSYLTAFVDTGLVTPVGPEQWRVCGKINRWQQVPGRTPRA